ncbi:hypothetical protein C8Q80DRAFT_744782 [Daedaleopsis nitida]|nr:hypothetical protein C8Q80DRAFT_744782 [Daedaleopsis nitida]
MLALFIPPSSLYHWILFVCTLVGMIGPSYMSLSLSAPRADRPSALLVRNVSAHSRSRSRSRRTCPRTVSASPPVISPPHTCPPALSSSALSQPYRLGSSPLSPPHTHG